MSKRAETGPMRFQDDWTGVFIRGDDAMHYGMIIEQYLLDTKQADVFAEAGLRSLQRLLQGSRHVPGLGEPEAQEMKKFEACCEEETS